MTVRAQIIQEIINKIDKIPEGRLSDILKYIKEIESFSDQKEEILSFAGKWDNIDEEVFSDLTSELHKNRMNDDRRIN